MKPAVDETTVAGAESPIAPQMLIPGARELGMLTSFRSAESLVLLPDGANTMAAATIADRQREGGGAPSERRSADERSWKAWTRRMLRG